MTTKKVNTEFNGNVVETKLKIAQRLATAKAQLELAQLNNKRVEVDTDLLCNLQFLINGIDKIIGKLNGN